LLTFCFWGGATVVAGFVWLIGALACDESCDGDAGWTDVGDAWQWSAVRWLGGALFLVATACAIAVVRSHRRAAAVLYGMYVLTTAAAVAFVWPTGVEHLLAAIPAIVALIGLAALRLARRIGPRPLNTSPYDVIAA
jgi:hypothetical protein